MAFIQTCYPGWRRFTLVTPADKSENVRFYTEKCGFAIQASETDGNVRVYRFILERPGPAAKDTAKEQADVL